MRTADNSLIITFNGEIYNFREIRSDLQSRGWQFQTATDTEVILGAYATWGVACLERFVGMFAFVIWDTKKQILVLARDRAGEKPLFYSATRDGLAFASELRALLALRRGAACVDRHGLAEYLTWGYTIGTRTLLSDALKLEPGTFALYDLQSASLTVEHYWRPPRPGVVGSMPLEDLCDELERLLGQSLRGQLMADVPVGVLLSGGLDSSVVAACAARANGSVKTFTVTFPDTPHLDESLHARRVAEHIGSSHTEIPVTDLTGMVVDTLVSRLDEPIADPSVVPTAILARAVREDVTVALGGDGGDELFGGYPQYSRLEFAEQARSALGDRLSACTERLSARLPLSFPRRNSVRSLFGRKGWTGAYNVYFDDSMKKALLPVHLQLGRGQSVEFARDDLAPPGSVAGERAAYADFLSYLPDDILVKVDRASMLASLEVRAPFLDHRVVEFALARVPWHLKCMRGQRKILLQAIAKRLLASDFDLARKQGFTPPLASWLTGPLYPALRQALDHLESLGFVGDTMNKLLSRPRLHAGRLFSLLMFSRWTRVYDIGTRS